MAHLVFIDSTLTGLNAFATAHRLGHQVTFIRPTQSASIYNILSSNPAVPAHVDHYLEVATLEAEDLMPVLDQLHEKHPIDAVLSTSESGILPAAQAAERLGTPYTALGSLKNAVFKHQMREQLQQHGIPTPDFECLLEEQLVNGPKHLSLPFVVKPVRGFAKQFSAICHTQADFDQYIQELAADRRNTPGMDALVAREYIVEQYVEGSLHSAEVVVRDGRVMFYATTTRYRAHYDDLLELAAVMPSDLSESAQHAMKDYLQQVFYALGISIGLYHVELLMTGQGPILVEINARMMGSVSPVMYQMQTDQDAFEHLIRLHLGEPLTINDKGFHNAGITLAVAARQGGVVVESFQPQSLYELLNTYEISHHTLRIEAGKEVARYKGNVSIMGHVILLADTPQTVAEKGHRFLCDIERLIGLETAKYFPTP
ncbi:ATP-grasp domain-containing protein [Spartinivicinus poritis]|uniref:ATP-grasp domain-containing protein n=1 Tax=Spartinivicinus poritis TaxID=2994640 RepID=A0ABT5UBF7_9GAMM|nr:ATP-grasp domain-containing protein [Spartinivicinus sp. A2-2]MDE1462449.1 ATP-grasp domain-containing protein [Spartinivicinus sp. A2-2]